MRNKSGYLWVLMYKFQFNFYRISKNRKIGDTMFLNKMILSLSLMICSFVYAQEVTIGFGDMTAGTSDSMSCDDSDTPDIVEDDAECGDSINPVIQITINSTEDISGYQFDVSGLNIEGMTGGLAEENGFTVSSSEFRVIG